MFYTVPFLMHVARVISHWVLNVYTVLYIVLKVLNKRQVNSNDPFV